MKSLMEVAGELVGLFCLTGGDSTTLHVLVGRANGKEGKLTVYRGEEIIDHGEGMKSETSKDEAAVITVGRSRVGLGTHG